MYTYDIRTSGSVELKHRSWLSMYRVTFSFHFPLLPYLVSSYVSRISRVDIFREENIFVCFFSLGLLVYIASKYSVYVVRFFFLFFFFIINMNFVRISLYSRLPFFLRSMKYTSLNFFSTFQAPLSLPLDFFLSLRPAKFAILARSIN